MIKKNKIFGIAFTMVLTGWVLTKSTFANEPTENDMKKATIIYVMDPLCGWCYGFSENITRFKNEHAGDYHFKLITGGMVLGDRVGPMEPELAKYIRSSIPRLQNLTGARFGDAFYKNVLDEQTQIQNSEPPSRAIVAFEQLQPDKVFEFSKKVQQSLYLEGKDLGNPEMYRPLVSEYADFDKFMEYFESEKIKSLTRERFDESDRLGVNGFPTVLLEINGKLITIGSGYMHYEELQKAVKKYADQ